MNNCSFCGFYPIPAKAVRCPRCGQDLSAEELEVKPNLPATAVERMADSRVVDGLGDEVERAQRTVTTKAERLDVLRLRPIQRPPMLLICVCDDGEDEGEWYRIRNERCTIGRNEGDVLISHDAGISGRHVELVREPHLEYFVWWLRDLNSANGTFVRYKQAKLKHGCELLIGRGRYRFETQRLPISESSGGKGTQQADLPMATRVGMRKVAMADVEQMQPALVELEAEGAGRRFRVNGKECWVGRDPGPGQIKLSDDQWVNPRHVRIYRDQDGQWSLEDPGSVNGTWMRVNELDLTAHCELLISEQRILVRLV